MTTKRRSKRPSTVTRISELERNVARLRAELDDIKLKALQEMNSLNDYKWSLANRVDVSQLTWWERVGLVFRKNTQKYGK